MNNLICIEEKFNGVEFVNKFFNFLDVQSKDTVRTYRNGIANFMDYLKKNEIVKPNREDVVNWKLKLKESTSASTVNTYLVAVKALFNFLEMYGIYPNISKYVKGFTMSATPKKNILTEEQIKQIYQGLTDKREKAIFGLMVTTGLRGVEVANAKIENIRQVNGQYCLFIQGKGRTEADEYVKLSETVLRDILSYINNRTFGNIFVSTSNHNNGEGITVLTVRRIIKSIFKEFNIDDETLSSHSLRRTFACECYNLGKSIYDIQQVLRHKNISTTTRYLQQVDRYNNNSEMLVSDILGGMC